MTALDLPFCAIAAPVKSPWLAHLELRFAAQALTPGHSLARSALVTNRHRGPLMVQKSLYPEGPEICHAVILHPPAGIAAGDHLSIDIEVAAQASALVSTPSATRWYKSRESFARQHVGIRVAAGARLEWLPEENLFYEDVRGEQSIEIDVEPGGRLLAWDSFMLGRTARGEDWQSGEVRLTSRLRQGNRLLFAERAHLQGGDKKLDGPAGLAGHRCGATLIALGSEFDAALMEQLTGGLPFGDDLMAACSQIEPGLLIMRVVGREAAAVRAQLQTTWALLRPAVMGRPARPLRLWAC